MIPGLSHRMPSLGALLVALAGPLVAAEVAGAQLSDPFSPPSFGATVDVEVVEVEVYVSDSRGEPVTGLSADDFLLEIDGELRQVASIYEAAPRAELSTAMLSGVPGAGELAPAPVAEPAARPTLDPDRRLSLVVLLDDAHLQPAGRKRTLARVRMLLEERIGAGDQVMVASLDRSLVIRRGFEDTGPLADTFALAGKRATGGIPAEVGRRLALSQIRDIHVSQGCEAIALMRGVASSWAQTVEHEARVTFSAVEAMLASLAGRSGRKVVLYVTEGTSLSPGLEAALLIGELCGGNLDPSTGLIGPVSRVIRAANAAQVTLYTLDAGGQRVLASAVDAGPRLSMANQAAVRFDSQDPVFALAADTGGRALLESNRPELLVAELTQDLVAFYSLAFTPQAADAGRAHRIRVKVKRPGVHVRHRSSWSPVPTAEKLNGRLLAALRFGGEEANPLGARLEAGAASRGADGSFTLPLRLTVPASGLVLVPRGERRHGSMRVLLAVQDDEGNATPVRAVPLPVDLAVAPAGVGTDSAQVPLEVRLRLLQGRYTVALAVHDEVGLATSVVRREVVVGVAR